MTDLPRWVRFNPRGLSVYRPGTAPHGSAVGTAGRRCDGGHRATALSMRLFNAQSVFQEGRMDPTSTKDFKPAVDGSVPLSSSVSVDLEAIVKKAYGNLSLADQKQL